MINKRIFLKISLALLLFTTTILFNIEYTNANNHDNCYKHNIVEVEKIDATCTSEGIEEHYYCTKCGQYFISINPYITTTKEELIIPMLKHDTIHIERVEPTCTLDGNIEYWYCSNTHKYFSDFDCNIEITFDDTILVATGHNLTYFQSVEPTCTLDGNIEYWYCNNCHKYFSDFDCNIEITFDDTILVATGHNLTYFQSVEPTYENTGYLEHYYCQESGLYFIFDDGLYLVTYEQLIIEKLEKPEIEDLDDSTDSSVNTSDKTLTGGLLFGCTTSITYLLYSIKRKTNKKG